MSYGNPKPAWVTKLGVIHHMRLDDIWAELGVILHAMSGLPPTQNVANVLQGTHVL